MRRSPRERAGSGATLVVGDLLQDIRNREPSKTCAFRSPGALCAVAEPTGRYIGLSPCRADARHLRVRLWMPVRREESVAYLSRGIALVAIRYQAQRPIVGRQFEVGRIDRVSPR